VLLPDSPGWVISPAQSVDISGRQAFYQGAVKSRLLSAVESEGSVALEGWPIRQADDVVE
jgi:hypothetical protein